MRTTADNFRFLREMIEDGDDVDYYNRNRAIVLFKGVVHYGHTHYEALSGYYNIKPHESRRRLYDNKIVKRFERIAFLNDFGYGIATIDDFSEFLTYDDDEDIYAKSYDIKNIERMLKKEKFKYLVEIKNNEIEKVIKL